MLCARRPQFPSLELFASRNLSRTSPRAARFIRIGMERLATVSGSFPMPVIAFGVERGEILVIHVRALAHATRCLPAATGCDSPGSVDHSSSTGVQSDRWRSVSLTAGLP